jgi:hypothetical protein
VLDKFGCQKTVFPSRAFVQIRTLPQGGLVQKAFDFRLCDELVTEGHARPNQTALYQPPNAAVADAEDLGSLELLRRSSSRQTRFASHGFWLSM